MDLASLTVDEVGAARDASAVRDLGKNPVDDGVPFAQAKCSEVSEKWSCEGEDIDEQQVLLFLDSLDNYLTLMTSLSSTLRQGWLELASARHSMGTSRISSAIFDLKVHSASSTVLLNNLDDSSILATQPHFSLSKWASLKDAKFSSEKVDDDRLLKGIDSSQLRHRIQKHVSEGIQDISTTIESTTADENFQSQRSKLLSVFGGALISPKLRTAQVSFEQALSTIVEIANAKSAMLFSFSRIQQDKKCTS
ncbi:hypothetical protein HPP92_012646 [Vanilla planifolia]|uniref:Vacuolar ATPase assembly protein VMA22 n=1 Tax=Vanilla planifolia TaxID=51239 RepID=A0A835QLY2_VANPL|nr:hypothetical protein HPP92_012646 [Vanilla planifolia]